jgi:REP-associated tyrosine transposase
VNQFFTGWVLDFGVNLEYSLIKMARAARQLPFEFRTWGGRREGAGRKPREPGRARTPHRARPEHEAAHPVHVTLRARKRAPYLRAERPFRAVREGIAEASSAGFRVVHFSVQPDHVHLIVEARDARSLSSGMRGLAIRVARKVNRRVGRRGPLWGDRWYGRALGTPREVRTAIVYVLANVKKHVHGYVGIVDGCSSAPWFDGFGDVSPARLAALRVGAGPPVRAPRTWLASQGWRRAGLVRVSEAPAG